MSDYKYKIMSMVKEKVTRFAAHRYRTTYNNGVMRQTSWYTNVNLGRHFRSGTGPHKTLKEAHVAWLKCVARQIFYAFKVYILRQKYALLIETHWPWVKLRK